MSSVRLRSAQTTIDTATGALGGAGSDYAYEYLKPRFDGKCANGSSAATAEGTDVEQYAGNGGGNQRRSAVKVP